MPNCFDWIVERHNPKASVVYLNHKISMRRFMADVQALAAGFANMGLVKGDVVTIYLPTCPHSIVAFYACAKMGLVANVVHPVTPISMLKKNLEETNSKVLMFYDILVRNEKPLQQLDQKLIRCSISDYVSWLKPIFAAYGRAGVRIKNATTYKKMLIRNKKLPSVGTGSDVVCYMHSGGTSGQAKIVKLTNNTFNNLAASLCRMHQLKPDGKQMSLVTLPVFHAYGLCAAVHTGIALKLGLVLVPKFKVNVVNRYFKKYHVATWSTVPVMIKKMLKYKPFHGRHLRKLGLILCGGDFVHESLVETTDTVMAKYGSKARLMRAYGLTETCGVCAVNSYDNYCKKSCGKPLDCSRIYIVDEQGKSLPPNTLGEIVVCSAGLMSGYIGGGETFDAIRNGVKTGDIGYLNEDGYLFLVDRKKRSIKIAAVNVFPSEVEDCIKQLPIIADVCVVPYRYDGKQYIKAYVTLNQKVSADQVEKQVVKICSQNLMRYSVPKMVEVIDQMPLTKVGKIDFQKLTQL